ncbi:MAG: PAS domain-containing protein [Magnetococcales bacterium]|nr:PAS domain-containing protein [Magnetococcales bacterium]
MGSKKKRKKKAYVGKKKQDNSRTWQFENTPDVIYTVDSSRQILLMNRDMSGYSPKQLLGKDSAVLFPSRIKGWYQKRLKRAFATGNVVNFQFSTEDSIWWEIRIVPVRHDKEIEEAIVICSDVTERRIRQAQAIRHARLATIGVLSAGVAHEINNPNGANLFNATLLGRAWEEMLPILEDYHAENGDFSLAGLPYSEAIKTIPTIIKEVTNNTERISNIVDSLKHFAGQDDEKLDEYVNINSTLRATMMILNHKVRKHTDNLKLSLGKSLPKILGNSRQLEQVFINVILNAMQSLASRDRGVTVSTSYNKKNAKVIIVVEDEGCGVEAQNISRLTEPFYSTKTNLGGTGLGLSISNLIIIKHGGTIHFEQRTKGGTRVTINFPVTRTGGK